MQGETFRIYARFRARTSMGMIRPCERPRDVFAMAWLAIPPWISMTARCGGFSPRSTIARERAPNASACSRVLCNWTTSKSASSRPRRVSSGVDRKLVRALLAQGVG